MAKSEWTINVEDNEFTQRAKQSTQRLNRRIKELEKDISVCRSIISGKTDNYTQLSLEGIKEYKANCQSELQVLQDISAISGCC